MKFQLAMIQMRVTQDKEENLKKAEKFVEEASLQGAQMAVLPEMFCCPYQTDQFPVFAEPEGGTVWKSLSGIASKCRIYLVAGSVPERDEEGKIFNTSYVFSPDGKQIAKHRKMHLFDVNVKGGQRFFESETLTAGNFISTFDTEYCKIGICICYDMRFPEIARLMALRGAEVLIVPAAFNMTTGPAHWELLFRCRAMENSVYTVGVAPARDMSASYHSYANSIVADPFGTVISRLGTEEEMKIVTIDPERVKEVREGLPMLFQRRTDIYSLTER